MEHKKTILRIVGAVLLLAAATVLLMPLVLPYIRILGHPEHQAEISAWMAEKGIWGVLAIFCLQLLQVVVAVIPGEAVELLAGALCGMLGGLALCLVGTMLASGFIFYLSKRFGLRLLSRIFSQEKMGQWKWLQHSTRSDLVLFLLFLIPGTPKDMLTYVVGITDITLDRFLRITTLARIPSVLSSTMIGASVIQGEGETALIVFVITAVLGIVGIAYKQQVLAFCRARHEKLHRRHKSE